MIKYYIPLLLCICHFQAFAQWESIPSGTTHYLKAVHFPTDSTGYIVGDNGTILRSSDMGRSWGLLHIDSSIHYNAVHFVNSDTGFIAGEQIYRTTNAGVGWEMVLSDSFEFHEIYFVNDDTGYAGDKKSVWKTVDGGDNWTKDATLLKFGFTSIHFPSPQTGYFVGENGTGHELFRTTDSGASYQAIPDGFFSVKESLYFLNDSVGYLCGWYNPLIIKTKDRGVNWTYLNDSRSEACFDVHFINEAVGYYIDNGGRSNQIYYTSDSGKTWTLQLSDSVYYLDAFHFINPQTAVVVGNGGVIYRTENGGITKTMNAITIPQLSVYPNPASDVCTIKLSEFPHSTYQIRIFSMMGQEVASYTMKSKRKKLNLTNLNSGVYLIQLSNAQQEHSTIKLVKQ